MNYKDNNENLEDEFLQYASIVKLTEGQEMSIADLKNAIDVVRTFFDAKDAKAIRAIASMDVELANLETELASKQRELNARDKEIEQLKEQIASVDKPKAIDRLVAIGNCWYVESERIGGDLPIPVCRNCTDKLNRVVYLTVSKTPLGKICDCPECKTRTVEAKTLYPL